jgi:hypothetical protein
MYKPTKIVSLMDQNLGDQAKTQITLGIAKLFEYFLEHSMFENSPENTLAYILNSLRTDIIGAGYSCLPCDTEYSKIDFKEVLCLVEHLFTVITYYSRDEIPGISIWSQDPEKGKAIFLGKINTLFKDSGYYLNEEGRFAIISESEMLSSILNVDIPENYQKDIMEAKDLHRTGYVHAACNKLGTVFEKFRKGRLGAGSGLNGDGEALMGIINNYSSRHGNRAKNQQKEVNSLILWDWVFYSLLNVVVTYIRLEKESI